MGSPEQSVIEWSADDFDSPDGTPKAAISAYGSKEVMIDPPLNKIDKLIEDAKEVITNGSPPPGGSPEPLSPPSQEKENKMLQMTILTLSNQINEIKELLTKKELQRPNCVNPALSSNMDDMLAKVRFICKTAPIRYHGAIKDEKVGHVFSIVKYQNYTELLQYDSNQQSMFPTTKLTAFPSWVCDNCTHTYAGVKQNCFVCKGHVDKIILDQIYEIINYVFNNTNPSIKDKIEKLMSDTNSLGKLWAIKTIADRINISYHSDKIILLNTDDEPIVNLDILHNMAFSHGIKGRHPLWFCTNCEKQNSIAPSNKFVCKGHFNASDIDIINKLSN